jgi:hypothetical protein
VIFNALLSDKWCTSVNRSITLVKSEHNMSSKSLKMTFIGKFQKVTNEMTCLKKWQTSDKIIKSHSLEMTPEGPGGGLLHGSAYYIYVSFIKMRINPHHITWNTFCMRLHNIVFLCR